VRVVSESGVCESSGRSVNSGGRSVRSVVIAPVLSYLTVKQQLPPSGGLPPSARMGRRRARLWALFQCCNPKAKAKTRKTSASAQVLEAEWTDVRAAGGWARRIGPYPVKHWGCVSFCLHGCGPCRGSLPARAFCPSGQDRPQQVDLVSGCADAAWRMAGGPTRRETLAGGVTGARGLSYRVSP